MGVNLASGALEISSFDNKYPLAIAYEDRIFSNKIPRAQGRGEDCNKLNGRQYLCCLRSSI